MRRSFNAVAASRRELQDLHDIGGLADRLRIGAGEDRKHRILADQGNPVFMNADFGQLARQT